jgi:hypothetical protein
MKIFECIDKKTGKERVWYQSENVFYSEIEQNDNEYNDLCIVFNNGKCYKYQHVSAFDYTLLKHNEYTGRTFYKLISSKKEDGTPKYQYKEMGIVSVENLKSEMETLMNEDMKEKDTDISATDKAKNEEPKQNNQHLVTIHSQTDANSQFVECIVEVDNEEMMRYYCGENMNKYYELSQCIASLASALGAKIKFI